MDRTRAAVIGLGIVAVLFGAAMLMRIAARLIFAVSYLLEAVGVLVFAIFVGWITYRILAGDRNDPRIIDPINRK